MCINVSQLQLVWLGIAVSRQQMLEKFHKIVWHIATHLKETYEEKNETKLKKKNPPTLDRQINLLLPRF